MNIFNKKLKSQENTQLPIDPIELYQTCQYVEGYGYLRGIQEEVLRAWHQSRDVKDVICKMNTGSGKTLTALLMLYSKMIEKEKPVVYLCPDKQLVSQTLDQAKLYGIPVIDFPPNAPLPTEFLNARKILVCTFQRLFNGKSVFNRDEVKLGALAIDDAHRCVDIARDQTSLKLLRSHDISRSLFRLFTESLKEQLPGSFQRLEDDDPYMVMKVPYWAWMDSHSKVLEILSSYIKENPTESLNVSDSLIMKWNFLADNLMSYDCVISGETLELNPIQAPYHEIHSFNGAEHRFILSATFEDDFDLVKDLGINIDSILNPTVPKDRKDIGRRLILAPNRLDPNLSSSELRKFISGYVKENINVAVLAPSKQQAKQWESLGATLVDRDNIEKVLSTLDGAQGKFLVFANRYDGIDLNGNNCRILVVDGLPVSGSAQEMYLETRLDTLKSGRKAQIIEQGLGRAVRSGSDFCVVFLMGTDLINFIGIDKNLKYFTPVTRAQLKMGLTLLDDEESEDSLSLVKDTASLCLSQHPDWIRFHGQELSGVEADKLDDRKKIRLEIAEAERRALIEFRKRDYSKASNLILDEIVNKLEISDKEKAWYYQLAAQLIYQKDRTQSNSLQIKACSFANNMFHPLIGDVDFKMLRKKTDQPFLVQKNIAEFDRPQDVVMYIKSILEGLQYIPEVDYNTFEEKLYLLGGFLGFASQRPEKELGNGPDVLWCLNDGHYLILEAKSESTHLAISRDNIKQLYHSIEWFKRQYGESAKYTGVTLQAPGKKEATVVINDSVKVVDQQALDLLRENLKQFGHSLQSTSTKSHRVENIAALLEAYYFTPGLFVQKYLNNIG
ncbi:DEAD/DEAH box helicase [Dyadobacter jiangsuensis]|uniref:Replicative superfamily II helicase n=1 Tax=Dyadobacter jiangsuensis TaxID=1591085 RepID=A0A2P8FVF8_9BACT|nr:DEAD/DEAH box helicase [Dyadobacter jiangsuensis]PSL25706.1 replicative superfamily II helicase [Dyadobacter jiangsuensis]